MSVRAAAASLAAAVAALGGVSLSTPGAQGVDTPPPYDRDAFGTPWRDVDDNGCDTRDDVLARDLVNITVAADGCTVTSGLLRDPYTGDLIPFVRGVGTSTAVQIDHVVALSDAWDSGAWKWTEAQRAYLANDPRNLLAVDGPTNARKSDDGPATVLAEGLVDDVCGYVTRYEEVKDRYGLDMTVKDRRAVFNAVRGCP